MRYIFFAAIWKSTICKHGQSIFELVNGLVPTASRWLYSSLTSIVKDVSLFLFFRDKRTNSSH